MASQTARIANIAGVNDKRHVLIGSIFAQALGPLLMSLYFTYLGVGDVNKSVAVIGINGIVAQSRSRLRGPRCDDNKHFQSCSPMVW